MNQERPSLLEVVVKTIVTHTVTYTVVGLLASTLFSYASLFTVTTLSGFMRPFSDRIVMAAPLLQPVRGVLFGLIFYLLRDVFFARRRGWLIMWLTLIVLGILGTFGPSPGSLEGLYFTIVPLWVHLRGLPEVLIQSLILSLVLFYWINHASKRWVSWVMGVAFAIAILLPALGLLVTRPA